MCSRDGVTIRKVLCVADIKYRGNSSSYGIM